MPPVNAIAQFIPGCGLYNIPYSARFRGAQWLTQNTAGDGDRQKFTDSAWLSRASLGSVQAIFSAYLDTQNYDRLTFLADDTIQFEFRLANVSYTFTTLAKFRDVTGWYNIQRRVDTTAGTNGVVISVNGVDQPGSWNVALPQNASLFTGRGPSPGTVNSTIGSVSTNLNFFVGYMAEIIRVHGAALPPSTFGYSTNGVWVPKDYTGAYGTNGFKLQFKNSGALGADTSTNAVNFTVNGLLSTDQMTGTPTSVVPTLNPLYVSGGTLSDANLTFDTGAASTGQSVITTYPTPVTGSWAWEVTVASLTSPSVGVTGMWGSISPVASFYNTVSGYSYRSSGEKVTNGTVAAYGAAYSAGDVIGHVYDADAGTLTFYKNGVSQGVAFTSIPAIGYFPAVCDTGSTVAFGGSVNFGQRPFSYTYGSAKPLSTANVKPPSSKPTLEPYRYFGCATYTGTGAVQSISLGFAPDFVWIKGRDLVTNHRQYDTVRGAGQYLSSSTTAAEVTHADSLTSFTTTGFTLGVDANSGVNNNGTKYVVWGWKAGGAAVTNTAGTISAQVSANPEAGFSVVTYTGTGANATVGHGLGTAPTMIIVKGRVATGGSSNWSVWHSGIAATEALLLNLTDAKATSPAAWNSTTPTATTFSLGTAVDVNASAKSYVAYCFSDREGYLKTGKYTGNGSADGPFVYCGFRPKFLLVKRSDAVGPWCLYDGARDQINVMSLQLQANSSAVEASAAGIDFLATGFKHRGITDTNASGGTYVFLAIAEQPLVGQCNVPSNAR